MIDIGGALSKSHVGLPNVDNTSDVAKPVSTAVQAALDARALASGAAAITHSGGNLSVSLAATVGPVQPINLTGTATTLNAVTGATDTRRLLLELYASGGSRTFTVAAPVVNGTTETLPLTIPSGKSALVGLYYSSRLTYPLVVSARVMP